MGAACELPELVTTPDALGALVATLKTVDRYALDTEFHRERTYWPRLALVQVAWRPQAGAPSTIALVDPQSTSPGLLADVFEGGAVMVAHAAAQDLEVLKQACGAVPRAVFDTQVAAGFVGHGSASLASLAERYLHVRLAKGDRLTDWSRRPLSGSQLAYAASDVSHLLELADVVTAQLEARGRLSWAEEECASALRRPCGPGPVEEAWWRLRDHRQLQGTSKGVAQEVAAWREEKARALDLPPRMVLPDLALLSIAHSPPGALAGLREVRGIDLRHLKGGADEEIMAAIARGRALGPSGLRLPHAEQVSKELRPAVALASAWVAQLSKDEDVDAALLATRADIVEFLSGKPDARLGQGWRAGLVGVPVMRLARGEASLALDGHGRLMLEDRPAKLRDEPPTDGSSAHEAPCGPA